MLKLLEQVEESNRIDMSVPRDAVKVLMKILKVLREAEV